MFRKKNKTTGIYMKMVCNSILINESIDEKKRSYFHISDSSLLLNWFPLSFLHPPQSIECRL